MCPAVINQSFQINVLIKYYHELSFHYRKEKYSGGEDMSKILTQLIRTRSKGGFNSAITPRTESKPTSSRRRGRSPVPSDLKRVQLRGACTVPQWMAEWLKKEGDTCNRIETALIEKYKLVPPENVMR
jgi:hypothetical protein